MTHDWKTVWSDLTGALYECRRCGVNHRVMFIGLDIHSLEPVPHHVCIPKEPAPAGQLEKSAE